MHEPPLYDLLKGDPAFRALLGTGKNRIEKVIEMMKEGDTEGAVRFHIENLSLGPGAWEQIPEQVKKTIVYNASTWLDETRDPDNMNIDLRGLSLLNLPTLLIYGERA